MYRIKGKLLQDYRYFNKLTQTDLSKLLGCSVGTVVNIELHRQKTCRLPIVLKISEGLADAAMKMLREEILKSTLAKMGYLLARPAFGKFKKKVDYAEYGGALLLGIKGIGIVCHGKSSALAIKNAIICAGEMERLKLNDVIASDLSQGVGSEATGI